ncbi:hypothetical protein ABIA39_001465 [Nocardia sp. GAS34]
MNRGIIRRKLTEWQLFGIAIACFIHRVPVSVVDRSIVAKGTAGYRQRWEILSVGRRCDVDLPGMWRRCGGCPAEFAGFCYGLLRFGAHPATAATRSDNHLLSLRRVRPPTEGLAHSWLRGSQDADRAHNLEHADHDRECPGALHRRGVSVARRPAPAGQSAPSTSSPVRLGNSRHRCSRRTDEYVDPRGPGGRRGSIVPGHQANPHVRE